MDQRETRALIRVLSRHAARYPEMEPADGVKLLYQSEFGGGHLVKAGGACLERLRAEWAAVPRTPQSPWWEDLGNGMVRVMLGAVTEETYPLALLAADFARGGAFPTGSRERFEEKLGVLRRLSGAGKLPFSLQALEDYLAEYRRAGYPAVSHSGRYRQAYRPAYRVLPRRVSLPLLVEEIQDLARRQERVLVALDGRCAAGKSTLGAWLSARYGYTLVHLDHFFLRPHQRTAARYAQPGGNVDHERFLAQVLRPLWEGRRAVYRPFDCAAQALGEPVAVEAGNVVVVEGSYSCHPALWPWYHLHVCLTLPPQIQRQRLLEREGPAGAEVFAEKWIPLEEKYLAAFHIPRRCEYHLELTGEPWPGGITPGGEG